MNHRIRVGNVIRKPSKRQLKRQDYLIVMTIAQVAELENRFPQEQIIYQIHHPEETVYEFPEVFKDIRSRFRGKMLAISPWTARTVSGPAVAPQVVPDVVSPVFWSMRNHPDRRKRDLDNILKALQDSLQAAGVYKDDCQIDLLTVKRCEVDEEKRGFVVVTITAIREVSA